MEGDSFHEDYEKDSALVLSVPLLSHYDITDDEVVVSEDDNADDCGEFDSWNWAQMWVEGKKQLEIAVPMVAMNLLGSSMTLVSLMFLGRLGEVTLSSASVASSFANVSGFSVLLGMASALETLCGQAFGAKEHRLLGIYMQRAIIILLCTCVPISLVWINLGHILVALGQDPVISFEAGKYATWLCPSLFAYAFLQPMGKFLQTQTIVLPMMLGSAFALMLHVPLCFFFVLKLGLGSKGAAMSINISFWLNVVFLALYILFSPTCKKTRVPISREALHEIKGFLKLAIPSALMLCLEWWSYEMLVLLSGLLPRPELEMSVLSISLATSSLAYMIPCGLGAAISTRVSNELGAGRTRGVKLAIRVVVCMTIIESFTRASVLLSVRNVWGCLYSNEPEVINYMTIMMPILVINTVMDGTQAVLNGITRGCGQQHLAAYANLAAYYIFGIPSAVTLGFLVHLGAMGLWLGILSGLLTQTLLLLLLIIRTDWNEQVKKARVRVYSSALLCVDFDISKILQ